MSHLHLPGVLPATGPLTPTATPSVCMFPSVCMEAESLVHGNRGADYGTPRDDFTRAGAIWGAILHEWTRTAALSKTPVPVPPELMALCMVGVKLSREVNRHKRDNLVDIAGYAETVSMLHDGI